MLSRVNLDYFLPTSCLCSAVLSGAVLSGAVLSGALLFSGTCAPRALPAPMPPAMPALQELLATTWTSLTSPSVSPALQDLSVPEVRGSAQK